MNIAVIDLKINNYKSVMVALSRVIKKEDTIVAVEDGKSNFQADLILLPGLGHFSTGMKALTNSGLDQYIFKHQELKSNIVGICLGMQLLGVSSEEAPGVGGLGLVNAHTFKLPAEARNPHIGWNSVEGNQKIVHFPTLRSNRDFYFVHSYHVRLDDNTEILSSTRFGSNPFTSSFLSGKIVGFQFHPEKSGKAGRDLLTDIYNWADSPD
jgi:glutamine amidotransferase